MSIICSIICSEYISFVFFLVCSDDSDTQLPIKWYRSLNVNEQDYNTIVSNSQGIIIV